jgi:hypothetical protein
VIQNIVVYTVILSSLHGGKLRQGLRKMVQSSIGHTEVESDTERSEEMKKKAANEKMR